MAGNTLLELRRDTAANWTSANPTLAAGEPGYETDTGKLKFGDGTTVWASLAYFAASGTQESVIIATSDESTALTTGDKVTIRMPYAFTLTSVKASLTTAQTSGSIFTVEVKKGGSTIFSTKPTIDNTEKTTATAATPSVLSTTALAADDEIVVNINQIGDGTAKGLKVVLIGHQ